jgi:hypothetical protein
MQEAPVEWSLPPLFQFYVLSVGGSGGPLRPERTNVKVPSWRLGSGWLSWGSLREEDWKGRRDEELQDRRK